MKGLYSLPAGDTRSPDVGTCDSAAGGWVGRMHLFVMAFFAQQLHALVVVPTSHLSPALGVCAALAQHVRDDLANQRNVSGSMVLSHLRCVLAKDHIQALV